jgi:hypothetical protein
MDWLEHLRHHQRVTAYDQEIQERLQRCLSGERPRVSHLVTPDTWGAAAEAGISRKDRS